MIGAELDSARDLLRDLEQRTAALQAQADSEAQALQQAQRAARDGSGTLNQVVKAQGQADAAHGVLSLHLGEVEQQRGRVLSLEQSQSVAQLIDAGQSAGQQAARLKAEGAQIVEQVEHALSDGATRFQQVEQQHRRAYADLRASALQYVAQALGLSITEVTAAVSYNRRGPQIIGSGNAERRAHVEHALSDFAAQTGSTRALLVDLLNSNTPELHSGPLVDRLPKRLA